MAEVIIIDNGDGTIGVMYPMAEALEKMTVSQIAAKDVPEGLDWRIVDSSTLPASRRFRNAWTDDGEVVSVDLARAKVLATAEVNTLAAPFYTSLKDQGLTALIASDTEGLATIATAVSALDTAVADLLAVIGAAETVEDLEETGLEEIQSQLSGE